MISSCNFVLRKYLSDHTNLNISVSFGVGVALLFPITLSSGVPALVVWAWPSRVRLRQRCRVRTTKMAAAAWSTSPSLREIMMSTSPSEAYLSQVTHPSQLTYGVGCGLDFYPDQVNIHIFANAPTLCLTGSPFRVPVRELVDPSKVRCSGPGLGSGVRAHVLQTFTVDSSKAGVAPLEVQLYGPTGKTAKSAWSVFSHCHFGSAVDSDLGFDFTLAAAEVED